MSDVLLRVEGLKTYFYTEEGVARAVDDVSLEIHRGKTLGLVGESGCGKSVTALSIMRLVSPPGKIVGGKVLWHDRHGSPIDLLQLSEREMRRIRGRHISMIFQEPMTSLNPVFTIGSQIMEAILLHGADLEIDDDSSNTRVRKRTKVTRRQARQMTIQLLRDVGIPEPERRVDEYPHQFSGGMRQRAMIAMALACNPELLIADEPTTALDVTIQAQILELLRKLQQEKGMAILIITHDLGIVAELADEVAVMYASKIVERASVDALFAAPLHPYTAALFKSRPNLGQSKAQPLSTIPGTVPQPTAFPPGCKFHPRCSFCQQECKTREPELREVRPGHWARCHFAGQLQLQTS